MSILLRWASICRGGEAVHVAVVHAPQRPGLRLHHHDFAELFWVRSGAGAHWINEQRSIVRAGDLLGIRPADVHGFPDEGGTGDLVIVNVAFPRRVLDGLKERYATTGVLWPEGEPGVCRLDAASLGWIGRASTDLAAASRDPLQRDAFLIGLLAMLERRSPEPDGRPMPDWLRNAMEVMRHRRSFGLGVAELVRLSGRSAAHLSRTVRDALGMTAVEWINRQRLELAAEILATTDLPVTEIAAAAGFGNLSHFHHCFLARYGQTPLRHRKAQRAVV